MKLIADLHLHSKYSRAVSQQMVIPEIAKWAKKKGINLVGAPDWTHPLQLRELKENLVETAEGIFSARTDPKINFLLATEISSIYSQGGKTRRIHNLMIAPSFETVEKVNHALRQRGANLMSDGRPIIGLSARELAELVFTVDKNCLIVPAHCLLPDENIHIKEGMKKIKDIKKGDRVYSHQNSWRPVEKVYKRPFSGMAYHIVPDYFRVGITVTGEHPFWAIKTKKNCRSINGVCKPLCSQKNACAQRFFEKYKPSWIRAESLEKGDVLLYPRFIKSKDKKDIKLSDYFNSVKSEENDFVSPGGFKRNKIPNRIKIDKKFCRLVGLYLAEGYTTRDLVSFCFNDSEIEMCQQVRNIVGEIFGIKKLKEYKRGDNKAIEITFYSKLLHEFFSKLFYEDTSKRKANNKCLPGWMLELPLRKQKEILIGWWQGDKGYTSSKLLANQMKVICLRLGIIPSIGQDKAKDHFKRGNHSRFENREIRANFDIYHFSNLSFFEDKFGLLELPTFAKYKTKMTRRRGWIDKDFVYLPIRKIEKINYKGDVYNLEVKDDHSFTTEFALVHNCWTPWFSLFGSQSGFDSLKECFGQFSDQIIGIETGLSSSPDMNWRIKELDSRSILSFSDAHSPAKLGREAVVFDMGEAKLSYQAIKEAIKEQKIVSTIEFYPEEGKYHYTGHRKCEIRQSPEETKKLGTTCSVCGRPLTIGVMHRVEELAGRPLGYQAKNRPAYKMLVPLLEVLSEALEMGVTSQAVQAEYERLISSFSSEFMVLIKSPLEEISRLAGERVSEAIKRVREGEIVVDPGYDGVFGVVKIWPPEEEKKQKEKEQMSLF